MATQMEDFYIALYEIQEDRAKLLKCRAKEVKFKIAKKTKPLHEGQVVSADLGAKWWATTASMITEFVETSDGDQNAERNARAGKRLKEFAKTLKSSRFVPLSPAEDRKWQEALENIDKVTKETAEEMAKIALANEHKAARGQAVEAMDGFTKWALKQEQSAIGKLHGRTKPAQLKDTDATCEGKTAETMVEYMGF